ncbi:hypothetical protein [Bacillus sp. JCM 19034]|uniref:hypothetical protein n=1 Tax=Bacillus sp. JCM 19034 TaxID=1481928 RepID=UPI0007806415|nr:hypothetical protein [Bacillus sp. JCM 19034]
MRVILETIRFVFIFFISLTILGILLQLIYLFAGVDTDKYDWTVIAAGLIFMFLLYKNRGWAKVYNRTFLTSSIIFIILLTLIIPDNSPTHLHSTKYAYSYGFPFEFITIYIEDGTNYLLPNLLANPTIYWNVTPGIFLNFILIYFAFHFINKFIQSRKKELVKQQ